MLLHSSIFTLCPDGGVWGPGENPRQHWAQAGGQSIAGHAHSHIGKPAVQYQQTRLWAYGLLRFDPRLVSLILILTLMFLVFSAGPTLSTLLSRGCCGGWGCQLLSFPSVWAPLPFFLHGWSCPLVPVLLSIIYTF